MPFKVVAVGETARHHFPGLCHGFYLRSLVLDCHFEQELGETSERIFTSIGAEFGNKEQQLPGR
eukprot:3411079-Amphidinium_carterae.1